ncbi:carboxymuconolactone decarboxylase family protein [Selenihalanaerobacter shriftii]|uniref:Alkylhydroperoxidase AhpD family core domain-containing protein n=1 Tax=Selenihalanaerobacter shriftii TaxID=142842 RepID=A0A1T4K0J7_9FIRM|nr:carboxymuconolactone decarboxylase family protein [Selenihalanaerobacter shriftii]SJZ35898.1 alkylhydroperoxidase AhpD family core domain-containing protein [Selenihalanaerobacter shriftii]
MKADEVLEGLVKGQDELKEEIPEQMKKFKDFSKSVMKDGALSKKQKKLIALGAALAKRCDYCIVKNLNEAIELEASKEEILEAASVVMLLDGGPGVAYSTFLLEKYNELTE